MPIEEVCSIAELDNYLKRFSCVENLVKIGNFSKALFKQNRIFINMPIVINNISYEQTITQWGLADIAYRLIMFSNDGRSKLMSEEEFYRANAIANNLEDPILKDSASIPFLFRMSQEQFWSQERSFTSIWARYKCIYDLVPILGDKFSSVFHMTTEEYFMILFGIFAFTQRNDHPSTVFSITNMTSGNLTPALKELYKEKKLRSFLNICAADYNKFRAEARRMSKIVVPGCEKYEINPLLKYPIVEVDKRFAYYNRFQYLVPNTMFFLKKMSNGIYWDLRDYFEEQKSSEFLDRFGKAYENYCGMLLKRYFGGCNVKRVEDILDLRGNVAEHADWFVDENGCAYIFECKSALLPALARQTFVQPLFDEWVDKVLRKGIHQLDNTENLLIKNGIITHGNVYKFLLILDDLYLLEISKFKRPFLQSVYKSQDILTKKVYFMRVFELERMEHLILGKKFQAVLKTKQQVDASEDTTQGRDFFFICSKTEPGYQFKCDHLHNIYLNTISKYGLGE